MAETEIQKNLAFDGKYIRIWQSQVSLNDGSRVDREVIEAKFGSVVGVVMDDKQNLFLVKEYRFAMQEFTTHLPGGRFDLQKEEPEEAIIRELREEIGVRPKKIERIAEFNGGGTWRWPMIYFFCQDLDVAPLPGDPDEDIEVVKVKFTDYLKKILNDPLGRFGDFKAIIMVANKLGLLDIKS